MTVHLQTTPPCVRLSHFCPIRSPPARQGIAKSTPSSSVCCVKACSSSSQGRSPASTRHQFRCSTPGWPGVAVCSACRSSLETSRFRRPPPPSSSRLPPLLPPFLLGHAGGVCMMYRAAQMQQAVALCCPGGIFICIQTYSLSQPPGKCLRSMRTTPLTPLSTSRPAQAPATCGGLVGEWRVIPEPKPTRTQPSQAVPDTIACSFEWTFVCIVKQGHAPTCSTVIIKAIRVWYAGT